MGARIIPAVNPFLLWQPGPTALPPDRVAPRVAALLAEFLDVPLRPAVLRHPACELVWVPLPLAGWRAPVEAVEGAERCLAFEYPLNLPAVAPGLCALGRLLAADDGGHLAAVAPPMSLLHLTRDRAWLLSDGLGAAQLYLHRGPGGWAITNRLALFEALGIPLRPRAEDWALRLSLPYFPEARTGFANVEYLGPGARCRIDADGLRLERVDAVARWIGGETPPLGAALDAVDAAARQYLDLAAPLCAELPCGLSGGVDSRAVVAAVRASGHPFRLRTKGRDDSPDVQVARELARAAGLPLRVKPDGERPPDPEDPADLVRTLRRALRWQGGAMIVHKHKTLFARGQRLTAGTVNVMGQYGEVLRARLLRLLGGAPAAAEDAAERVPDTVAGRLLAKAPRFWRPEVAAWVRAETARLARAVPAGLDGPVARLEAFYLLQDVRRWTTGTLRAQLAVTLTPLLTPASLRAAIHSPPAARLADAFQWELVARHAPEWRTVPVATAVPGASRYFDNRGFWTALGWARLRRATGDGLDFCRELCDVGRLEATWLDHPDEAALLLALPGAFRG